MIEQELAQRAVLEALEGKIEALRALSKPDEGIVVRLYFWEDLAEKYQQIFRSATVEDVSLAISKVAEKSGGRFKLVSIKPLISNRKGVLSVALAHEIGRPLVDVSNLYWEIQYSEKYVEIEQANNNQIYWLTSREVHSVISDKRRSLTFKPEGVQYRLLEWFCENKGFTKNSELVSKLNTTTRTIRTEIRIIRRKANEAFGLDGNNFIESSQGEGYKLSKTIKIKKESGTS